MAPRMFSHYVLFSCLTTQTWAQNRLLGNAVEIEWRLSEDGQVCRELRNKGSNSDPAT